MGKLSYTVNALHRTSTRCRAGNVGDLRGKLCDIMIGYGVVHCYVCKDSTAKTCPVMFCHIDRNICLGACITCARWSAQPETQCGRSVKAVLSTHVQHAFESKTSLCMLIQTYKQFKLHLCCSIPTVARTGIDL